MQKAAFGFHMCLDLWSAFFRWLGIEFALVPKGKAWLGGGDGKEGTKEVNIAQDFYLGVYEVTQEEWQKIMGKNPSEFSRRSEERRVGKECKYRKSTGN